MRDDDPSTLDPDPGPRRLLVDRDQPEMITPGGRSMEVRAPYGLGMGRYELTCGIFYGHGGSVNGTQSLALASEAGTRVVVIAFNGRSAAEPGLVELADSLVCPPPQT